MIRPRLSPSNPSMRREVEIGWLPRIWIRGSPWRLAISKPRPHDLHSAFRGEAPRLPSLGNILLVVRPVRWGNMLVTYLGMSRCSSVSDDEVRRCIIIASLSLTILMMCAAPGSGPTVLDSDRVTWVSPHSTDCVVDPYLNAAYPSAISRKGRAKPYLRNVPWTRSRHEELRLSLHESPCLKSERSRFCVLCGFGRERSRIPTLGCPPESRSAIASFVEMAEAGMSRRDFACYSICNYPVKFPPRTTEYCAVRSILFPSKLPPLRRPPGAPLNPPTTTALTVFLQEHLAEVENEALRMEIVSGW